MKLKRCCWTRRTVSRVLVFTAAAFMLAIHATAAPAGGGLPWEAPMTAIATSLTGPVAYAIGLIGIAIAGGTMLQLALGRDGAVAAWTRGPRLEGTPSRQRGLATGAG